jgi:hypothetical protein
LVVLALVTATRHQYNRARYLKEAENEGKTSYENEESRLKALWFPEEYTFRPRRSNSVYLRLAGRGGKQEKRVKTFKGGQEVV